MNIPNRLSIARVGLIPICVLFLHIDTPFGQTAALIVFLIAVFTDWLDGYIARRDRIVTNFGKFIDPVADKLLVLSTMIALCGLDRMPAWACILVLFRELAVDGLRLIAAGGGKVIAAGNLGKIKTVTQMTMLTVYILKNWPFGAFPMDVILLVCAMVMTVWSGVDYFIRNKGVLSDAEDVG